MSPCCKIDLIGSPVFSFDKSGNPRCEPRWKPLAREERVQAGSVHSVLVLSRCSDWTGVRKGSRGNTESQRFDCPKGGGETPLYVASKEAYVVSGFLKLHGFLYFISWSNKFSVILFILSSFSVLMTFSVGSHQLH